MFQLRGIPVRNCEERSTVQTPFSTLTLRSAVPSGMALSLSGRASRRRTISAGRSAAFMAATVCVSRTR